MWAIFYKYWFNLTKYKPHKTKVDIGLARANQQPQAESRYNSNTRSYSHPSLIPSSGHVIHSFY